MPTNLHIALTHRLLPSGEGTRPDLVDSLTELGHRVTLVRDALPDPRRIDIVLIASNANWHPEICRQLRRIRRASAPGPFVVVWHSEPLPLPKDAPFPRARLNLRELAKILLRDWRATDPYTNARVLARLASTRLYDLLVVSTPSRQAYLAERGIAAHAVPLGYHPSYGRDLGIARDIDVLFLGDPNVPRRRRLLDQLRAKGVQVEALGSWFTTDTWGEKRTRLLNRTRILLNLQRFPGELSGQRMILGMANKALVISEPIFMPGPFLPGTHWVSATVDEMPEVIARHLGNEQNRQAIVEAGYDLVMNRLTLKQSAAQVLALAAAARSGNRDEVIASACPRKN